MDGQGALAQHLPFWVTCKCFMAGGGMYFSGDRVPLSMLCPAVPWVEGHPPLCVSSHSQPRRLSAWTAACGTFPFKQEMLEAWAVPFSQHFSEREGLSITELSLVESAVSCCGRRCSYFASTSHS